jgi:hypothetical protein
MARNLNSLPPVAWKKPSVLRKHWQEAGPEIAVLARKANPQVVTFYSHLMGQLIARRVELGWSRADLGDVSGFSQSIISKWECGHRIPTMFSLVCWITALGLEVQLEAVDGKLQQVSEQEG